MQDLEVQVNNQCGECQHFLSDGDRCDKTSAICYRHSEACKLYEEKTSNEEI